MTKLFGFFMEIIRLILILLIGLFVLGYVEQYLFKLLGVTDVNWFFAFLADLIFIYIIYKNKLQFTGWFSSDHNTPLSKQVTKVLLIISVFLLIISLFYNSVF